MTCPRLLLALAGCQSTQDWMKSMEPIALRAGENRGRFELDCPTAAASILNEQDVAPEIRAVRFSAPDRAVFTVGIQGCNKRATYVVVCPHDGTNNCFAADGRR